MLFPRCNGSRLPIAINSSPTFIYLTSQVVFGMFFSLVFVLFWAFFATTVNSVPQYDIALSPTDPTEDAGYPVDGSSVATIPPDTEEGVTNPTDTTEDPEDNLNGGNFQDNTNVVIPEPNGSFQPRTFSVHALIGLIDQRPASSNLIASAEPESDPSCNPDASSQEKRQLLSFDFWNPLRQKPKTPDIPAACKPRGRNSAAPEAFEVDRKWKCSNGFYFCCAVLGAALPERSSGLFTRELCVPRKNVLDRILDVRLAG